MNRFHRYKIPDQEYETKKKRQDQYRNSLDRQRKKNEEIKKI